MWVTTEACDDSRRSTLKCPPLLATSELRQLANVGKMCQKNYFWPGVDGWWYKRAEVGTKCRTRDNFVRDWLHQLLYWVLSSLLVGSGANFLPIEAHGFSLLDATLHYISSLSCNNKNAKVQQKFQQGTIGTHAFPLLDTTLHIYSFLSCNHQNATNATKCTRAHFLPIDARGFSILGATIHYTSFLSCNHQNAKKCSGAKFLSIKAQGFCILSTTPFSCNLHFFIVDESSECTASWFLLEGWVTSSQIEVCSLLQIIWPKGELEKGRGGWGKLWWCRGQVWSF